MNRILFKPIESTILVENINVVNVVIRSFNRETQIMKIVRMHFFNYQNVQVVNSSVQNCQIMNQKVHNVVNRIL